MPQCDLAVCGVDSGGRPAFFVPLDKDGGAPALGEVVSLSALLAVYSSSSVNGVPVVRASVRDCTVYIQRIPGLLMFVVNRRSSPNAVRNTFQTVFAKCADAIASYFSANIRRILVERQDIDLYQLFQARRQPGFLTCSEWLSIQLGSLSCLSKWFGSYTVLMNSVGSELIAKVLERAILRDNRGVTHALLVDSLAGAIEAAALTSNEWLHPSDFEAVVALAQWEAHGQPPKLQCTEFFLKRSQFKQKVCAVVIPVALQSVNEARFLAVLSTEHNDNTILVLKAQRIVSSMKEVFTELSASTRTDMSVESAPNVEHILLYHRTERVILAPRHTAQALSCGSVYMEMPSLSPSRRGPSAISLRLGHGQHRYMLVWRSQVCPDLDVLVVGSAEINVKLVDQLQSIQVEMSVTRWRDALGRTIRRVPGPGLIRAVRAIAES
eukprot:Plantae.Rhodophyta-Rhodochaete_pulchella.ctg7119.p1 GENE.Plantae.Rhodophyta-Rhodochaete_pulchella.ctg7119~~Plantae.Rhodophyta-Rhodochaete_pulchella.ctg7119.p1  ORF type:complete len:438 (+),score=29.99 Plantae.Rhodophyta-Rhodochaete_pulchella.ctg7119:108-1421(+)